MSNFTLGRIFKSPEAGSTTILGTKDHWTRDGRYVEMIRYQSSCAEPGCKRIFRAMTTKSRHRRGQLNKRCELHHAPGCAHSNQEGPQEAATKTRAEESVG